MSDYKKTAGKGDLGKAMEYKEASISKFQKTKEHSIMLSSSGRDAVLMVTSYKEMYKDLSEEQLKNKIIEWRKWLYNTIYDTPFI